MIGTEAKSGDVFGKCNIFHFFLNNCWHLKPISPVADTRYPMLKAGKKYSVEVHVGMAK